MEVKDVVDAPLLDVRSTVATHVLPNDHGLVDCLEMLPTIHVHDCDLRVELHAQNLCFRDENATYDPFRHVHDQLQIEARNVRADEVRVEDLAEWDPVQ